MFKSEEVGMRGGGQISISGDLGSKETVCQQPYVAQSTPVLPLGIFEVGVPLNSYQSDTLPDFHL